MGFNAFHSANAVGGMPMMPMGQMAFGQGSYDSTQAQFMNMYGRAGAPPPPMPQTNVPGIDLMRFYILGQVS